MEYAVALGLEAGVGTVVLFHHSPTRTDDEIDAMLAGVSNQDVRVVAASEGLVLERSTSNRPATPTPLRHLLPLPRREGSPLSVGTLYCDPNTTRT
ncbi:MAG: hypothetical protein WKF47_05455 [Geodermatophilaceae bacterium]